MDANLDLDKIISGQIQNALSTDATDEDRSRVRRIKSWISKRRSEVKPWGEFFNTRKFARPNNVAEASSRVIGNVKLYQANYFIICVLMAFYCILTSPLLLFGLSMSIGGCYYISTRGAGHSLKLFGKEFTTFQQYGLVFLICMPLFFFASAGSTVFWIIGASLVVIVVHASMLAAASNSQDNPDMEMQGISLQ